MKKYVIRFILITLGLLASLILFATVVAFRLANRTNGALVSSGDRRAYLLYVPESYDPSTPAPLVISMKIRGQIRPASQGSERVFICKNIPKITKSVGRTWMPTAT